MVKEILPEFPEITRWGLKSCFFKQIYFDYLSERLMVILNIHILQGSAVIHLSYNENIFD